MNCNIKLSSKLFASDKCAVNMIDQDTNVNVLTILASQNSDEARNALIKSTVPFTVPATSDLKPLRLVMQINSASTPLVMSLYFKTAGITNINYYFENSVTKEEFPQEPVRSDPAGDTVNVKFTNPLSADQLIITLTPASTDSVMTVERLFVKACFSPGKHHLVCSVCSEYNAKLIRGVLGPTVISFVVVLQSYWRFRACG